MLNNSQWSVLTALAIGLLIGVERERRKGAGPGRAPAGLRTFAIVGLLGGLSAATGETGLVLISGAFVAVATIVAYALSDRQDLGLTGEVALVATFILGVLAQSQPILALEVGIIVTALLAFRVELHRFVRERISDQELLDALTLAICAVVILPMLPNRAVDPFGLLNPFTLWRLAVVAMALSWGGYIAQRLVGARYGLLVAGLAAGFVSSTACVAAMGGRSRAEPALQAASAAGAVASFVGSLAYLSAVTAAVSPSLLMPLAPSLAIAILFILIYAAWLARGSASPAEAHEPQGRAFNRMGVVVFVALIGGFSILSELLIRWLGPSAALGGALIMGLADAHAAAVSMATLFTGGRVDATTAAIGVLLAVTTNMVVKIPTAFVSGSRPFALRVSLGAGLVLAGLWIGSAASRLLS